MQQIITDFEVIKSATDTINSAEPTVVDSEKKADAAASYCSVM
jgi:hypothetical protein